MMFAPGMAINFYGGPKGMWSAGSGILGTATYSEEQSPMHIYTFLDGDYTGIDETGVFLPKGLPDHYNLGQLFVDHMQTPGVHTDTIIYPDTACYVYFYPYVNDTVSHHP